VTDALSQVTSIEDPYAQLRAATERMADAQREVTELARLRRRLIRDFRRQGLSYAEIAEAAGLSRGRIHQLRGRGPAPEGAFLGRGLITIATPLKQEAVNARPVVAAEDFTATQRLAELARSLGLDVEFDHVPLGGDVDLNRPGLIVICGPRLSAPVASVLSEDPHIRFERAPDGPWTLRDITADRSFRSGADLDPAESYDYAYLGRLSRPDRSGSLIIFTGVHPPGSLGVVQLLSSDLAGLYEQVGERCFSTIVRVDYDPSTLEPSSVHLATPLYDHTAT
jgi:hypothetical protein